MSYDTPHTLAVGFYQEQGGIVINSAAVTVLRMEDGSLRAVVDALRQDAEGEWYLATVKLSEGAYDIITELENSRKDT